ncbi:hypothetical protein C8F04DRAFT_1117024 [Mycena alexandri]|uniref:G-protein coupled receptors family 2 profile 2 domain-containing protein n=1 Tax=Mycena alexandri TaxID=1745969 RepID=A0AAD6SKT4_9AGAR|nr:hypothetical protein C8F04DRAFT_1117024 [Mycena alexandri]
MVSTQPSHCFTRTPMSPRLHTPTTFDSRVSDLVIAFAVADVVFISLILGTCVWAACNSVSRPHLNRVSFRLLVYALVSNLAYALYMMCGVKLGPGAACNGITFFGNACLMFAAVMFFCVALNLELVLVHGVNGQSMEKYYVSGAVILTLACVIPAYAAGAIGYWAANETCWFNSPDSEVQLRWWIGTQGFWMLLMSAGEVVCFLIIVGFMIMRQRLTSALSTETFTSSMGPSTLSKPPIVAYRSIILRIGLYPLVSCFFCVTGGALDLHDILDTTETEVNWRLNIVDLLVYSLRPMIYAALAATDPSFLRALRALRGSEPKTPVQVKVYVNTWRSSATSSAGRPSTNCDTELGFKSIEAEEESTAIESEASFTRQI